MDKKARKSWELRREARRKRRQRQIISRCLLVTAGFIVLGFGINKIMKEDADDPAEDKITKTENEDADQMISDYPSETDSEEICIVLDAGHGGTDPGTLWEDIYEKDINLAITQKLKEILEEAGYQVVMTRSGDDRTVLKERVRIAEENHAAAFVSIHQNALENDTVTKGIQVYYNQNSNRYSKKLAESIHTNLLQTTRAEDKGNLENDELYILNHTTVPACLVETGFLTAKEERRLLLDEAYQQKLAEGMAKGIIDFLR